MYQTISKGQFRDAFLNMGRKDQFTYEGLGALYDYLEEVYSDNELGYELDVIALCCDYTEYATLEEFNAEHDPAECIDDINERTQVIKIDDDSFIIQAY